MEYRRLGKSGLKVSVLSYGSWVTFGNQLDESQARECLALAYDHGVNFFDNAEVYAEGESERLMGAAIRRLGWGRDSFIVSSKAFWGGPRPTQMGLSRKHLYDACHAALKRLQVDYLDLFYCHRPDIHTPVEETVWAMNDLIRQGKILYWGTSEWPAQKITEAFQVARQYHLVPPTMEQPEYNLLHRDRVEGEYAPLFESYGLGTTTWSPLASGILTGKYNNGIPRDSRVNVPGYEWLRAKVTSEEGHHSIEKVKKLSEVARALECSTAQLSIAWCLKNPQVSTVILGASRKEQLVENLGALDVFQRLSPEALEEIESIFQNAPEPPEDFT